MDQAERDQLRQALGSHQQDLLNLVKRLRDAIEVPPLQLTSELRTANPEALLGLDGLTPDRIHAGPRLPDEIAEFLPLQGFESGSPTAIVVVVEDSDPQSVVLVEEDSLLWESTKQHLGRADPLWREVGRWKIAFLDALNAQAALNRMLRRELESTFGCMFDTPLQIRSRGITPEMVAFARMEITRRALGQEPVEVDASVRTTEFRLDDSRSGSILADGLSNPAEARERLGRFMEDTWRDEVSRAAARAHRKLRDRVEAVRKPLTEYLLLHHVRGRCRLCRKLSG